MKKIFLYFFKILLALSCLVIFADSTYAQDKLLDLLKSELQREMTGLKNEENPPYYMSYRVKDVYKTSVSASFGTLVNSNETDKRYLTISVRVGSNELDNTHEIRDQYGSFLSGLPTLETLPKEYSPDAIRQIIWKATNTAYRQAADKYAKVKANVSVKVANEDTSADFSSQEAGFKYYEAPPDPEKIKFDIKKWEEKVKNFSAPFLEIPDIYSASVSVSFEANRKYFVSTEGAEIVQNTSGARIMINAIIKSEDGMELPLYKTYFAYNAENLPKDEIIMADVKEMIKKLEMLRDAPVVDPYTGPAILSGRAAGVFFHEIFGHRVEGHRQKSETEGQTFKKMVGEKILPETMSVIFDPNIKSFEGKDLNGYYQYDDEGMKGEKVTVVDKGILKEFLMNRSPIENFEKSNGHGRAQEGYQTVSRQSNLIVETTNPLSGDELRKLLIDECKKQGKEFGYLFMDITGGFTITGRTIPNSFNVMPTEVYRVYVDGRPDEIVRGVDIVGTPLAMFSQIAEAGNDPEIFNGTCGAESGGVPVSSVSPSIFVKIIEMQKKSKSQDRPPLLPRPDAKSF
jgi:TldD protein